jgi:hypothetical protein
MDLSFTAILDELTGRLSGGPFRFRLIVQPTMAAILGARAGVADAKSGMPPFILSLLTRRTANKRHLETAARHLIIPVLIATLLDALVQYIMFGHIRPVTALIVGSVLMSTPYSLARALSNRVRSRRGIGRDQPVTDKVQPVHDNLDPDRE